MSRLLAFAIATALPIAAAAQDANPPRPKKICRTVMPTGSILGQRVCMTKDEWARFDQQNGEHTDQGLEGRRNRTLRPDRSDEM